MNQEEPLATRMMNNLPGFFTMAGFNINRGANTIMRGGYLDETLKFDAAGKVNLSRTQRLTRKASRMDKFRTVQGGDITAANRAQYLGGRKTIAERVTKRQGFFARRAERMMGEGTSGVSAARRVNHTPRPRNFTRMHSLTALTDQSYTPFQGGKFLGNTKTAQKAFKSVGVTAPEGQSLLGAGTLSFVTAGRKADRLERRVLKKLEAGRSLSDRMAGKLGKIDNNLASLARMNNPTLAVRSQQISYASSLANREVQVVRGAMTGPIDDALRKGVTKTAGTMGMAEAGTVGVRGNLMASAASAPGSRFVAGYARGALGFGKVAGLTDEALRGAKIARVHMAQALRGAGIVSKGSGMKLAGEALEKGVFKTLGVKGTFRTFGTSAGAKVLGARAAAMAIPGLNVVAAASLVYDLGKMAGEVVKSGVNLARDAVTSMKGSINKPLFGMGYKDTEAAATSRARGVMAIQNSRLNARSALGSEAGMLAAHFG